MARGDGIDRTNARNMRLTETKIGNTQQHNEREKDSYINQDIVLERTPLNVHFKTPSAGYREMFSQMEADGVISTRGIKADAFRYGELVFDVNSAYFYLSLIHICALDSGLAYGFGGRRVPAFKSKASGLEGDDRHAGKLSGAV